MSCVPPHLLQRATILYRATELFVVSVVASCMPSFSCMTARIVRCFGRSVKDKERAILATRPVVNRFKNRIRIFVAPGICTKLSRSSTAIMLPIDLDGLHRPNCKRKSTRNISVWPYVEPNKASVIALGHLRGSYGPIQRLPHFGKALKVYPDSRYWCSQGSVFTNTPEESTLIRRLGGAIFESAEAAEAHGLRLCKKWIDKNLKSIDDV
jgi:hypothetical protein